MLAIEHFIKLNFSGTAVGKSHACRTAGTLPWVFPVGELLMTTCSKRHLVIRSNSLIILHRTNCLLLLTLALGLASVLVLSAVFAYP